MSDGDRDGSDRTILVVEDDPALAELYASWLAAEWSVIVAHDGEDALEEIDGSVSVVLLDRRMPGQSGDDVLEAIHERDSSVRVAMVTGVEPGFDIVEMGFDDYLVKPVTESQLVGTVEQLLLRSTYDEQIREFFSLASKRAILDQETTRSERDASDEYQDLLVELRRVRREVDRTLAELADRDAYDDLCLDLARAL